MQIIHKLPRHVADLIAAGEVVERPASAAKELIENAIDAGASSIIVEAQNGGVALLRVTDDGCGMSPDDAKTAFLRHATSKIKTAEDLNAVKTLGFRGEALAAISAVSRVDLLTRGRGSDLGCSVHAEGGTVSDTEPAGCPFGTTIVIRDLFYNTPARQKFLKKDNYEMSQIQTVVIRAAQSHPEITFTFLRDGREELRTPGNGDLLACLHSLWGRETAMLLAEVKTEHMGCSLTGFIGRPQLTRGSRDTQYFFVNGRPVRSRTISAAMEEAFKHSVPSGRFPVCSLHLRMPEEAYDVNVHPAKLEVKFVHERHIFEIVFAGTRDALLDSAAHREWEDKTPAQTAPKPVETPKPQVSEQPAPPGLEKSVPPDISEPIAVTGAQPSYAASRIGIFTVESPPPAARVITPPPTPGPVEMPPSSQTELEGVDDFRYVGEVLGGFLLAEQNGKLIIIDKHAAHERKLFDNLSARGETPMAQTLMSPVVAALTPGDCAVILDNKNILEQIGFEISDFGSNSIAVRAVPDAAEISDIAALLSEMAAVLRKGGRSPWEERKTALLEMVACKAAVKLGGRLSECEAVEVVRWVLKDKNLWHCPHGRPVAVVLTRADMDRQFLR